MRLHTAGSEGLLRCDRLKNWIELREDVICRGVDVMAGPARALRKRFGLCLKLARSFGEIEVRPTSFKTAAVLYRGLQRHELFLKRSLQTWLLLHFGASELQYHHRAFRKLARLCILAVGRWIDIHIMVKLRARRALSRRFRIGKPEGTANEYPFSIAFRPNQRFAIEYRAGAIGSGARRKTQRCDR